MNRPVKLKLAMIAVILLLVPFSVSFAQEAGRAKDDVEPGLNGDTLQSPQLEEQDRYSRLLKEYVESINNAQSDEERAELRKKFDEQTSEYRKYLAEEEESQKKREVEKEKQALEQEYNKKLRLMEQKHASEMQRLERECRKVAVGIEKNWGSLEYAECQKKKSVEKEYQRQLKFLKNDYDTSLRVLQSR